MAPTHVKSYRRGVKGIIGALKHPWGSWDLQWLRYLLFVTATCKVKCKLYQSCGRSPETSALKYYSHYWFPCGKLCLSASTNLTLWVRTWWSKLVQCCGPHRHWNKLIYQWALQGLDATVDRYNWYNSYEMVCLTIMCKEKHDLWIFLTAFAFTYNSKLTLVEGLFMGFLYITIICYMPIFYLLYYNFLQSDFSFVNDVSRAGNQCLIYCTFIRLFFTSFGILWVNPFPYEYSLRRKKKKRIQTHTNHKVVAGSRFWVGLNHRVEVWRLADILKIVFRTKCQMIGAIYHARANCAADAN